MLVKKESNDSEGNFTSSVYSVVPWVNWDEWNYVRRSIFSSCPKSISAALQKISAWESRGCLPIAVELTAVIIEIHQKDPFFRVEASIGDALTSEKMLNMLYCMFILRLVNEFIEPAHKKTGRSVSDLAEAVGIPRTFVDIRHESTHRVLPSLKLVRSASKKALEWLKANYWELQSIAIHDPRKEIKSKLYSMILCLSSHQVLRMDSPKNKINYSKRAPLLMACRKLSHINDTLLISKSDVSKAHITKLTRRVAHLYSMYPSDVVSVLLEFFLSQASDISDSIDTEYSDDFDCSVMKPVPGSLTDLKTVITKVSRKNPRLLLSLLKEILEMIEDKESRSFENGSNNFSAQNQDLINKVRHLRSLVPYLIRNLKALKESGQILPIDENASLSTEKTPTPKFNLTSLLHKCLTSLVPGDKYLLKSVLLLAEMSGSKPLIQKLKSLPFSAFLVPDQFCSDGINYNESLLLKEEESIKEAEERLDLIKLKLAERKNQKRSRSNCRSDATTSRWTVTKSWTPCPIGMLPCSFSSTPLIPFLDVAEGQILANKSETATQKVENLMQRRDFDDVEAYEDGGATKKLKLAEENKGSSASMSPLGLEGRLLIGSVWKRVSEEELASLESDVRIFA